MVPGVVQTRPEGREPEKKQKSKKTKPKKMSFFIWVRAAPRTTGDPIKHRKTEQKLEKNPKNPPGPPGGPH